LGDLTIYFPYKPYPSQVTYMKGVIDSLNSGTHAALESPTGTGKTLCLITSCLAWLNNMKKKSKDKRMQIIYTSRTHS